MLDLGWWLQKLFNYSMMRDKLQQKCSNVVVWLTRNFVISSGKSWTIFYEISKVQSEAEQVRVQFCRFRACWLFCKKFYINFHPRVS